MTTPSASPSPSSDPSNSEATAKSSSQSSTKASTKASAKPQASPQPQKTKTDPDPANPNPKPAPAKAKRCGRRRLWVVLGLLGFLVLLVALLPTFLSAGPGKGFALKAVNGRISGKVEVQSVRIGWLASAEVKGLVVRDEAGAEIVKLDHLQTRDASLLGLLRHRGHRLEVTIDSIWADIVEAADGTTNLQRALASPDADFTVEFGSEGDGKQNPPVPPTPPGGHGAVHAYEPFRVPADLALALTVERVDVTYRVADQPADQAIRLELNEVSVKAPNPAQAEWAINGTIRQGDSQGDVSITGTLTDLFDEQGVMSTATGKVEADLLVDRLPLALVAIFAEGTEDLMSLLGDTATVSGHVAGPVSGGEVAPLLGNLSFTSGAMRSRVAADPMESTDATGMGAVFAVSYDGEVMTLAQPGAVAWTITPETLAGVTQTQLIAPVTLDLNLSELTLPFDGATLKPDLAQLALDLEVTLSEAATLIEDLGLASIRGTRLTVISEGLGAGITANLVSDAALDDQPGGVDALITMNDLFDASGTFDAAAASVSMLVRGVDAPVAPIADGLLELDGWLTAAMGPMVSATLMAEVQRDASIPASAEDQGKNEPGVDTIAVRGPVTIAVFGDGWSLQGEGAVADGAVAMPELVLDFAVTPRLMEHLNGSGLLGEETVRLGQPANLQIAISEIRAPLSGFEIGDVQAGLRVTLDRLVPQGLAAFRGGALQRLEVGVPTGRMDETRAVSWTGAMRHRQNQGRFDGGAQLTLLDELGEVDPRILSARLGLDAVPVEMLDGLAGMDGLLLAVLGEAVTQAEMTVDGDPRHDAQILLEVDSPGVTTTAGFQLTATERQGDSTGAPVTSDALAESIVDRTIRLTAPTEVHLRLDEARLAPLVAEAEPGSLLTRMQIDGAAEFDLTVDRFTTILRGGTPIDEEQVLAMGQSSDGTEPTAVVVATPADAGGIDYAATTFHATLVGRGLRLKDDAGASASFGRITGEMGATNLLDQVDLLLRAFEAGRAEQPALIVNGAVTGLALDETGALNTDALGYSGAVRVNELASGLVDQFAGTGTLIGEVLGDVVTVRMDGALPGEMMMDFASEATSFRLKTIADDTTEVRLAEAADLSFDLTRLNQESLLRGAHPIFDFLLQTNLVELDRISVSLEEGAVIPLRDFDLSRLNLSGAMNLGEIRMDPRDDLTDVFLAFAVRQQDAIFGRDLTNLLGSVNQALTLAGEDPIQQLGEMRFKDGVEPSGNEPSRARFSPMNFRVVNGTLEADEAWLTTRGLRVGFQGSTDLTTRASTYSLGIPGDTILKIDDELLGDLIDVDHVYEFGLVGTGGEGGSFQLGSEAFAGFLQQGIRTALQRRLVGAALGGSGGAGASEGGLGGLGAIFGGEEGREAGRLLEQFGGIFGGQRDVAPLGTRRNADETAEQTVDRAVQPPRAERRWNPPTLG